MRGAAGLCLALAVCMAAAAVAGQQRSAASRSTADGVYTREQAERGKKGYAVFCASCHADDLSGTNSGDSGAPPLQRAGFMEGSDANGLFTKIQQTMPLDAPGGLSTNDYLDILAFIFQENRFPAGTAPLTADADVLKAIRIVRAPAQP